jgi:hypothetical protein
MNTELSFKFKGERTYIQGGDIFDALESTFSQSGSYVESLSMKRLTAHNLLVTDNLIAGKQAVGVGKVRSSDGCSVVYYLYEASQAADRYNYLEENIANCIQLSENCALLDGHKFYSVIENLIALTKKLCYALEPTIDGKWLFGQIILLDKLPETFSTLHVCRRSGIPGKFNTNTILLDGNRLGEINFVVGKP